jgi:hypothetical protein
MASPRPWPFDEDRPSGSVRPPLRQADLQAILAHLNDDDPDQLLASTSAGRPVVAVRVRANVGQPGGSAHAQWRRLRGGRVGRLDPDPALAGGRHPRHRCRWGSPWPPGGAPARPGGGRAHGHGGRLGAAVPAQPRRHRLAARGGRGAAHRSAARPPGAAGLGGPARPGRPREPGQLRPLGDRPGRRVRRRLQAVSRPPPAGSVRAAVAWPLPPHRRPAGGVVRGRPGRPGSWPTRKSWCRSWLSTAPRSPGARSSWRGCRWWRPGGCQACSASSRGCWGPSGSPPWPTGPGFASTPPTRRCLADQLRQNSLPSGSCITTK